MGFALSSLLLGLVLAVPCGPARAAAPDPDVDRLTQEALALSPDRAAGRTVYRTSCSSCHGGDGGGSPAHLVPALAGQRFTYLVRQLATFATNERDSDKMHAVLADRALRVPQTWVNVASFLSRGTARGRARSGSGAQVALGRAIFREQCASCHGPRADGNDEGFVPALRGQHYPYLVDQVTRLSEGARHTVDEPLAQFLRSLDGDEVEAVADFLSRLPPPSAAQDHPVTRGRAN